MERTDISGKKDYKELSIKPVKRNLSHYCFIAVRTLIEEPLNFFIAVYQQTNYLFQMSKHPLDMSNDTHRFSFHSFEFKDNMSEYAAFCIVNKSLKKEQYLFRETDKNSCYVLPRQKTKNKLSISFQSEEEETEISMEENDWNSFKRSMQKTSVNLMGKIDYVFPVDIQTYEILKPLMLNLPNIPFLNHQFIDLKQVMEIDSFFPQWQSHVDKLNKEPQLALASCPT